MIKIDNKKKVFVLDGKNYSYIIYVNEAGTLQFVYYGKKVDGDDYLTSVYAKTLAPEPNGFNIDNAFNVMHYLYFFFF